MRRVKCARYALVLAPWTKLSDAPSASARVTKTSRASCAPRRRAQIASALGLLRWMVQLCVLIRSGDTDAMPATKSGVATRLRPVRRSKTSAMTA
eukprot:886490-Pyramimonas_sp.AAC.1